MENKAGLYCALCWQEFEHPVNHDADSSVATEGLYGGLVRLNGHCVGDIRRKELGWKPRVKREPSPALNLDAGEPLRLV